MLRNVLILLMAVLLSSCATTVSQAPIQPSDPYYNKNLKVEKTYVIPPSFWVLGFTLPAASYKAEMRDNNGIYFSSPTPLLAKDPLAGTVYRTGGIYYDTHAKNVHLYVLDTSGFAGTYVSSTPLNDLKYRIK